MSTTVHIPEKILVGSISQGTTSVYSYWSGGTYDGAPLSYQATFEIQSVSAGYPNYYNNPNLYNANDIEIGWQFLLPNGSWYDVVDIISVNNDNEVVLIIKDTDLRVLTNDSLNDPPSNGPIESTYGILYPLLNGLPQISSLAKFASAFPTDSYWVDDIQAAATNYIAANGTGGGSGSSGSNGTSGTSGTDGQSGSSGTSGIDGTSGSSGTSGQDGQSGSSGTSGSSGISGVDGSSGTSGQDGQPGTSGTSGTSGVDGFSGTSGSSGTSGTSDRYSSTSTTNLTISNVSGDTINFTGEAGLAYTFAQDIVLAADASNYMVLHIVSYDSVTGNFSTTVEKGFGSGNYSSWTVNLDGAVGFNGTSGTSGISGTSGSSGSSGTTGTSGTSGVDGTSGTSGSSGQSGTSGSSGSSGVSGTSGTSGSSGSNGTDGTSGSSGSSGTNGMDGTSGSSGSSGSSGISGLDGTSGSSGTSGQDGQSGSSGIAYVLEKFGVKLSKKESKHLAEIVQDIVDTTGKELSPVELYEIYRSKI